jgi:hypothetical protein
MRNRSPAAGSTHEHERSLVASMGPHESEDQLFKTQAIGFHALISVAAAQHGRRGVFHSLTNSTKVGVNVGSPATLA